MAGHRPPGMLRPVRLGPGSFETPVGPQWLPLDVPPPKLNRGFPQFTKQEQRETKTKVVALLLLVFSFFPTKLFWHLWGL